jgi:hypothetical protein
LIRVVFADLSCGPINVQVILDSPARAANHVRGLCDGLVREPRGFTVDAPAQAFELVNTARHVPITFRVVVADLPGVLQRHLDETVKLRIGFG